MAREVRIVCVETRADKAYRKRVAARIESWNTAREASAKRRATVSGNKGVSGALNPAFVLATLSGKLAQDDVVLNEAIRNPKLAEANEKITAEVRASYVDAILQGIDRGELRTDTDIELMIRYGKGAPARVASGHVAAAPSSDIKPRRFIRSPRRQS